MFTTDGSYNEAYLYIIIRAHLSTYGTLPFKEVLMGILKSDLLSLLIIVIQFQIDITIFPITSIQE